jgi:hypothetical protein
MASGSFWSRCPPVTLCAVIRDGRQRHDDEPSAEVNGLNRCPLDGVRFNVSLNSPGEGRTWTTAKESE